MTAAQTSTPSTPEWRDFLAFPSAYVHAIHLAACFGGKFEVQFCEQLGMTDRLHGRLSALIAEHYVLPDWTEDKICEVGDRTIALASGNQIHEMAMRSGAIYWSANIASAVLAHEVEAFHKQLGGDLCTYAVAHRELAGPKRDPLPQDDLREVVLADGWRCVESWRRALPDAVGRRVLLKLAPNPLLDMPHGRTFTDLGPAIVRRAAGVGGAHG